MWKTCSVAVLALILGSCTEPNRNQASFGVASQRYFGSCLDGKIFELKQFDYATNGKTGLGKKYQPPQLGAEVTDTTILNDINAAAFGNTPAYFQKELCNLEYLFIDRNLSSKETAGWGFWEAPDQSSHGVSNSFVGISPSVWSTSSGGMLASLTQYKTNILASMLSTVGVSTAVAYSGANENGKVVLLRAILAHEVGHILYRSGKVVDACSAEYDLTWDKYGKPKKPKRMLPFGYQDGKTSVGWRLKDIRRTPAKAVDYLRDTYASGGWASFLATSTPEEDFVETFTMAVLTGSGSQKLTRLVVDFKDGKAPVDIAQVFLASSVLQQKAGCFTR